MKVIKLVDSFSYNHFHEMFNASFLIKLCYSSDIYHINYYVDPSVWRNVENLIIEYGFKNCLKKITHHKLPVAFKKANSFSILMRNMIGALYNIRYAFTLNKNETLILSINNPFSLSIVNKISKNKTTDIKIICHGEIELLIQNFSKIQPSFWYKYLLNNFFKKGDISPTLHFIILGKHIKEEILKLYSSCSSDNFLVMDHPYLFSEKISDNRYEEKGLINLGIIGAVSNYKGFHEYNLLVDRLKAKVNNKIIFNVIGSHSLNVEDYPLLQFASKDGLMLNTDIYNREIDNLDYILFFYKSTSYTLTASGAIFDAISRNKFIISLKNNYFEYVFSIVGPFGYLVNDLDEMFQIISRICIEGEKNDELFKNNLQKAREVFGASSPILYQ